MWSKASAYHDKVMVVLVAVGRWTTASEFVQVCQDVKVKRGRMLSSQTQNFVIAVDVLLVAAAAAVVIWSHLTHTCCSFSRLAGHIFRRVERRVCESLGERQTFLVLRQLRRCFVVSWAPPAARQEHGSPGDRRERRLDSSLVPSQTGDCAHDKKFYPSFSLTCFSYGKAHVLFS